MSKTVYLYEINETSSVVIPVLAETKSEASKIFSEWYNDDRNAVRIQDLLDDNYGGRAIDIIKEIPEEQYEWNDIMLPLPEERPNPIEPSYTVFIRYVEPNSSAIKSVIYDASISKYLEFIKEKSKKYYLLPDSRYDRPFYSKGLDLYFNYMAVPKGDELDAENNHY